MLKKTYAAIGAILIGGYATGALFGWEYFKSKPRPIPSKFQQSPGGHAFAPIWYTRYRGGK